MITAKIILKKNSELIEEFVDMKDSSMIRYMIKMNCND